MLVALMLANSYGSVGLLQLSLAHQAPAFSFPKPRLPKTHHLDHISPMHPNTPAALHSIHRQVLPPTSTPRASFPTSSVLPTPGPLQTSDLLR